MICAKCGNSNDDEYVFCVNCGSSINSAKETELYPSVATLFSPKITTDKTPATVPSLDRPPIFDRSVAPANAGSNTLFKVIIALLLLMMIGGGVAAAAYFLWPRPPVSTELFPEHLGLFAVDNEARKLNEVGRRDVANLAEARDAILKESSPFLPPLSREFILYSDPAGLQTDELKLIRIDSINNNGTLRRHDFQIALVENKPAMKRLRIASALPNGKYAFAQFKDAFDQGSHKLWPFEISGASASDSNDAGIEVTLALREKDTSGESKTATNSQPQKPAVEVKTTEIPTGARAAYCNDSNVIVRASPSLTARKVNGLKRGQRVYLISYSSNSDVWNGIRSNWAYIQTENGRRGWVFAPFISY